MFCPECRVEYRPGFRRCSDCDVDLVEVLPEEESSEEPLMTKEVDSKYTISKFTAYRVLVVCLLGIVGSMLWWQRESRQKQELQELRLLYSLACGGDQTSFTRLKELKPSDFTPQLEQMAAGQQGCFADARVAAIEALSSRGLPNKDALTGLLSIDQPFVVRHAAAQAYEQNGCDEACITATLHAANALWKGEAPFEAGLSSVEDSYGVHVDQELKAKIDAELRTNTEQDHQTLLNMDPCASRKVLKSEYATAQPFLEYAESRIAPCKRSP
jgi:hypothetical protein